MFRRKLNADAPLSSGFALQSGESGCCDDNTTVCKYANTRVEDTVTGINYVDENGDTQLAALAAATSNLAQGDLVKAITAALKAKGITPDTEQPNINIFLNAEEAPDTVTLEIFSAVELVSIVYTVGGTIALTKTCVENVVCRYKLSIPEDADVDLTIDDEVVSNVQAINNLDTATTPGTTATLSAISAAFQTALVALYAGDFKQIVTKYDASKDAAERYTVYFWLYSRDHKPTANIEAAGAESIALCECRRDYTA